MRTLFFALVMLTIGLIGCKSTETEQEAPQQIKETIASRSVMTTNDAIKEIVAALKNQDTTALNKYINDGKGVYFISSTQGAYSDCIHYKSAFPIFEYSNEGSEYEANPLKYLMDYLNNVDMSEMEVVEEDLFGVEACDFHDKGFFLDSNKADIKLLTDIYNMNTTRDDMEIDPTELVKLGETQNEVTKTLYIGDGEVTYTLYLTEEDNQWWITVMDFRDCDT